MEYLSKTGTEHLIEKIKSDKQDTLVSGTNIKTINNESLVGSGNITIESGITYTQGTGITISDGVISADMTAITNAVIDALPSAEESEF